MTSKNKKPKPGGAWASKKTVDCSRRKNFNTPAQPSQYTIENTCAFLCAAAAWHRDMGMVLAKTSAESRRSALAFAFAVAFLRRAAEADRLDRIYIPSVIAGHTRHTRAARILAADARQIAAHADAVAAEFLDQLQG